MPDSETITLVNKSSKAHGWQKTKAIGRPFGNFHTAPIDWTGQVINLRIKKNSGDGWVQIFKLWIRVGDLFRTVDTGEVKAHPRITTVQHKSTHIWYLSKAKNLSPLPVPSILHLQGLYSFFHQRNNITFHILANKLTKHRSNGNRGRELKK